jgi:hypothetical protein
LAVLAEATRRERRTTDDGQSVAVNEISQKYTRALKSFTDFGKSVEDGERARTPKEEKTIGKKMERKAH